MLNCYEIIDCLSNWSIKAKCLPRAVLVALFSVRAMAKYHTYKGLIFYRLLEPNRLLQNEISFNVIYRYRFIF